MTAPTPAGAAKVPRLRLEDGRLFYARNGVFCGYVEPGDDGFYVWWPEHLRRGYIDGPFLQELAELLERMNEPWAAQIEAYMKVNP